MLNVKLLRQPKNLVSLARRLIKSKIKDSIASEYGQGGIADEFLPD